MDNVTGITTAYGLYALIVVQLFGLIKIYIDRGTTKKQRDEAIEALRTRQGEISTVVDECKSKSDTILVMQKDIQRLQEEHAMANTSIDRLNSNMVNLQLEVAKVASSVTNLTENVNRLTMTMDKVFDKLGQR